MTSTLSRRAQSQRGASLVSLMVGVALSLLCVVVAMHAYRVTVLNSRGASVVAKGQNVSAAAALQLAKILPQAGWGMNPASPEPGGKVNLDLVLIRDATFVEGRLSGAVQPIGEGAPATGNALVWASAMEDPVVCRALVATPTAGLQLAGPVPCASASAAVQVDWSVRTTLIPAEIHADLSLTARLTECWPFGGAHVRRSAQVRLLGTRGDVPPTCLPNIQG